MAVPHTAMYFIPTFFVLPSGGASPRRFARSTDSAAPDSIVTRPRPALLNCSPRPWGQQFETVSTHPNSLSCVPLSLPPRDSPDACLRVRRCPTCRPTRPRPRKFRSLTGSGNCNVVGALPPELWVKSPAFVGPMAELATTWARDSGLAFSASFHVIALAISPDVPLAETLPPPLLAPLRVAHCAVMCPSLMHRLHWVHPLPTEWLAASLMATKQALPTCSIAWVIVCPTAFKS